MRRVHPRLRLFLAVNDDSAWRDRLDVFRRADQRRECDVAGGTKRARSAMAVRFAPCGGDDAAAIK